MRKVSSASPGYAGPYGTRILADEKYHRGRRFGGVWVHQNDAVAACESPTELLRITETESRETAPSTVKGNIRPNCPPKAADGVPWNQFCATLLSGTVTWGVLRALPVAAWNNTTACVRSRVLLTAVNCRLKPPLVWTTERFWTIGAAGAT